MSNRVCAWLLSLLLVFSGMDAHANRQANQWLRLIAAGQYEQVIRQAEAMARAERMSASEAHMLCHAYARTKHYTRLEACLDRFETMFAGADRESVLFGLDDAMPAILLMPIHRARGQVYLPTQILASVGLDRDGFLAGAYDERMTAAIQAFAGFGLDHLRKARVAGAIPKSLVAAFLPATLAEPVLKRAMKIGHAALSTDIRPPQWRRQMAMMRLLLTGRL